MSVEWAFILGCCVGSLVVAAIAAAAAVSEWWARIKE